MIRHSLALLAGVAAVAGLSPAMAQDLLYSERHELTLEERPTPRLTEKAEVSIRYLSPRSTSLDEFYVWEQFFGPVENLRAEVNGKRLRRDAFQRFTPESEDVFLSSGTVNSIDLPDTPNVGDNVTYSYERTYVSPAYAPVLRVPDIDRLGTFDIVVNHPEDVSVEFNVFAPRGEVDYTRASNGERSSISFRDLEPLEDLPLFAHNGAHAYVLIDIRRGDQAFTPTSPDEFANWYANLVDIPRVPPTILPLAQGLEAENDSATVAAFHDYVRESIRYIADERDAGAFVPRAPDLVVERKYGDCKDRAFLVSGLAQSLGLRVDPVLISTVPEPEFEEAHIGLFNHVICAFTHDDGTTTYFDPTDPYSSFGDLPESDVDGHALRLGQDGAERLFVQAQDTQPTLDLGIDLDLDAPEAGEATVTIRGSLLSMVRAYEARQSEQDARNALSGVAGSLLYKIRLSHLELREDEPRHRVYSARVNLEEFVIASPTKRYLPLTPFRAVDSGISDRREDDLMIYTEDRPNVRLALDVAADAWQPDETARALGDPTGPVWFSAEATSGEGTARIVYEFGQRTRRFLDADREAYLQLADDYLGARRDVIIFRSPDTE
ncbi:MAG: hypothetical protein AAGI52_14660 [Bacteroidota bacterium]